MSLGARCTDYDYLRGGLYAIVWNVVACVDARGLTHGPRLLSAENDYGGLPRGRSRTM